MHQTRSLSLKPPLTLIIAAALLAACSRDHSPTAPSPTDEVVATLKSATIRYKDLDAAKADGFVFLHGCEVREDGGPVGTVYVNMGRLADGLIDPTSPDALIYAPDSSIDHPQLVGVELAIPYSLWPKAEPPTFLGASFQREDEFGVFGLHAWVWRTNPKGLFAESNPNVSC
jgi:hypothetical protein